MKMRFILLLLISLFCCNSSHKRIDTDTFFGYWIPEKINWEKPNSGIEDIDHSVRLANFKTLYFDESFIYIYNSIQGSPVKNDSLIFEFEPGIEFWKGKWRILNSAQIEIRYRLIHTPFKGGNSNYSWITDTLHFSHQEKKLFFDDSDFVKTSLYNDYSCNKIQKYQWEFE